MILLKRAITRFRRALGRFLADVARKFAKFSEDFLFFGGLAVIIWTNFRVSNLFGWYSLGVCLTVLGVLAALRRPK